MGDAEIIPLGTRGRPGRGTGSRHPSKSARDLASGGARRGRQGGPPADAPVEDQEKGARDAGPRKEEPAQPAGPTKRRAMTDSPRAEHPRAGTAAAEAVPGADQAAGTQGASSTSVRDRAPGAGIPVSDWVDAFAGAAREIFGESWEPRLAEFLAFLRRRVTGDYAVDDYGFDAELTERFFLSAVRPIAEKWFRVEVRGVENIPTEGGALVVSNHSGTVPIDGLVTAASIHDRTGRHLRPLGADLVFRMPVVGEIARKGGATLACNEDAERLLRGGELVGVWPEGFKGIGKPYAERYKLQRFGRGGFVSAAMRTGVPIVPCSVVGAEEIYPLIGNIPSLARLLGVPYIPITPLFPWLGPLGLVPLPSKWLIEFGEPIRTDSYDDGGADDPMLVFNVTDQVRETIQQTLYSLLMQRRSVFS